MPSSACQSAAFLTSLAMKKGNAPRQAIAITAMNKPHQISLPRVVLLTFVYTGCYDRSMIGEIDGFDWDEGNTGKCQKHGLKLGEIEAVFRHPHRLAPDMLHSATEARFLAIGNGQGARPIFVVFALRKISGERLIRPISARYMHRQEISSYEEDTSNPDH